MWEFAKPFRGAELKVTDAEVTSVILFGPDLEDNDSQGQDRATWWNIGLESRYWLGWAVASLPSTDMNDGPARARARVCRSVGPKKRLPPVAPTLIFCQLEVTQEAEVRNSRTLIILFLLSRFFVYVKGHPKSMIALSRSNPLSIFAA